MRLHIPACILQTMFKDFTLVDWLLILLLIPAIAVGLLIIPFYTVNW